MGAASKTYEDHLAEREAQNYASTRRWTGSPDAVGMLGERELARFFGMEQDLTNKPGGDGGCDLSLMLEARFALDVKSARSAPFLLVDIKKIKPLTIYVLAQVNVETDSASLIGWEWGRVIAKAPTENWCGNGVVVHKVRASALRPMSELLERLIRRAP